MKNFVEVIDYFFGIKNPCTDNRNEVYSPECSGNPFCFLLKNKKIGAESRPGSSKYEKPFCS